MNYLEKHLGDTSQIRRYRFWLLLCIAGLMAFLISNLFAYTISQFIIGLFTENVEEIFGQLAPYLTLVQGISMALFCLAVVWIHNRFKLYKKDFMINSLKPLVLFKWLTIGIVLTYGFNYIGEQIFPALKADSDTVLKNFGFGKNIWTDLATISTIAIIAPISEELAYRGLVLKIMRDGLSRMSIFKNKTYIAAIVAILVAAYFFATLHSAEEQKSAIPFLFLNAVVSGVLYLKSKSFYVPVLVHSLNNSLVIIIMTTNSSEVSFTSPVLYLFAFLCPFVAYFFIRLIGGISK